MQTLDRKKAPQSQMIGFLQSVNPTHFQLSNGIPVYMINEGDQEVLRVELVFKAGNYYQKKKQVARATNALLSGGTQSHTAEEIAEHFDFYGAHFETHNSKDNAYAGLYTLNKHLEHTLPMLAEVICDPEFPEQELEVYRSTRKEHLGVNLQKVKYLAKVHFHEQIFGADHPYGTILKAQHLDDLKREDLVEHHQKCYLNGTSMIVVSGKIPEGFETKLKKHFGGVLKGGDNMSPEAFPLCLPAKKEQFIHKKDALQAAIRLGKPTITRLHPDYMALSIVNTILGGYFGSRLMNNIREDKGYTYGIGSSIVSLHHSGMFLIASEVGSDVLEPALAEIFKEIRRLREQKVKPGELNLVKNYLMGMLMRSLDGPFEIAERLRTSLEFGLTLDYYRQYAETIQSITSDKIISLANEYLHEDSLFLTVAGRGR